MKYKFKHLIKNCTNSCEGTLIKLSHRSENSAREYYTKENVPIYQYIVQGKPYFYKGANGLSFKIGIIFTIVSILFLLLYQRLFTTFFIILLTLLI